MLDADGDGKISRSSEFVFTEWDRTATGDLEAIQSVFDTNQNGLLDAGDERWAEFKVMVDGQLVSLASLDIVSIGLTPTGSGQNFADGSSITGTAQYTKTDGTTGAVGDAVLVADENGYVINSTTVTNGDGSKTTDLLGYGKDGTLAFKNRIVTSADGLSKTTQFDDDGNGTYESSQSDVTTVTAGVRQRVISNFHTDGSLADRTTTTTSAGKTTVTTALDQDGDGASDQTQIFVRNPDGSTTTTITENSSNGTLLRKVMTTAAADGLSKTIQVDSTGTGTYDLVTTETTVVAGDGSRTKMVEDRSSGGLLIAREQTAISSDGRTRTVSHDLDGNGVYETRDVTAVTNGANGVSVTTVSSYSSTNALIGRAIATTSSDGLVKTVSSDLDGDGFADVIITDTTVVGSTGSLTQTQQEKSRDGSLLASSTTTISADRKNISIATDADGNGLADSVKTIVVDGVGVTTSTTSMLSPNGSLIGKTFEQSSADGLSLTSKDDLNSDGAYDLVVTDVTTTDGSSNRTRTITTRSANNTLVGSTAITTSADSLTQTVKDDINADGTVDRTTVATTVLGGDGSRTETATTTSANGTVLAKTEIKTSANRKTTTTKIDANGDTKTDRTIVATVNSDGSRVTTISDTDINGVQHAKTETTLSADRLVLTDKYDINGDGIYDAITQAVTAIASTGVRTTTTSKTSSNGSLMSRAIIAVSANGLSIDAQFDADGDGVVEEKSSDTTVLNPDGSTTRTVSELTGTNVLVGKTITTVSANGLGSTVQVDLDGNGTIDRTSSSSFVIGADGSKTDTLTVQDGTAAAAQIRSVTSADKRTVTVTNDFNGNGTTDESRTVVRNDDGSTTETMSFVESDVLRSKAIRTTSANGLSIALSSDQDGNGTIDQSATDITVLNADGSKTQTITEFNADNTVKNRTTIITSANGLSRSVTWAASGSTTSRSMTDVTVLNADGSTTQTVIYRKANGSLEQQAVTTVSADKRTKTILRDIDGGGRFETTTAQVVNADGSVTTTATGRAGNWSASETTSRTVTVSADGLSEVTQYGPTSFKQSTLPIVAKVTSETVLGADGSMIETIRNFQSSGALVPSEQTKITTSGNGLSITKEWDLVGDGTFERKQTNVTVLSADGVTTRTVSKFDSAVLTSSLVTTTSANGLSVTTNWDTFGANAFSQDSTDVTIINADGRTTRTVTNLKADGSQLSKFVTTTSKQITIGSVDQHRLSVTTQEDVDGVVGFDRTKSKVVSALADGTMIETYKTLSISGVLLESEVVTTSADGRTVSIIRDADGDGTTEQTEVTTNAVDGSVKTVITDISAGNHISSRTTVSVSANGLLTTSEWDFDGNGSVDQRRTAETSLLGDGSRQIDTEETGGRTIRVREVTSDDRRFTKTDTDIDGDGDTDRERNVLVAVDGTTTVAIINREAVRTNDFLLPGEIYWKQEIAKYIFTITSADGLIEKTYYDYDGTGSSPLYSYNPDASFYEVTSTTITQIDGSKITEIFGRDIWNGPVTSKGILTVSADGRTKTLLKDADNNGTYEHKETAVTRIDGSIQLVVQDFNSSGALTASVITDVSADGKSTSVIVANATTGTGSTASGVGVEFTAVGSTNDTIISDGGGDDHLRGGAGLDTLKGRGGDDILDGGADADAMTGGVGNDLFIVDNVADQVIEGTGEGHDSVQSSVTFTISDVDVENLTLVGDAAIDGTGNASANTLTGNSGNNTLNAGAGNDILYGGDGSDILSAWEGNDRLIGGKGDDHLWGWSGDDQYVFSRGDGSDNIVNYGWPATTLAADIAAASAIGVHAGGVVNTWLGGYYWQTASNSLLKASGTGTSTLVLTGGIKAEDLSFSWAGGLGEDLWITIAGGPAGDRVILSQQALAAGRVENLQLDGLPAMNFLVARTADGTIGGSTQADIIFGLSGNEVLNGNDGNDMLYAGAGADLVNGGNGNDIIYSGAGNDYANGNAGDDSFVYRRGDGLDSLDDMSYLATTAAADISAASARGVYAGGTVNQWVGGYYWQTSSNQLLKRVETGTDTLVLEGISADDLSFSWFGAGSDNLSINIAGGPAGDALILQQQGAVGRIEKLKLDGLGAMNFVVATSVGGTVNAGSGTNIIFGLSGNETLTGNSGSDYIYGGAGNDSVLGDFGDDTLVAGIGNDYMHGGDGSDRFIFRRGDGADVIFDFNMIITTAAADLNAAQAVGVHAGGIVNTWVNGYHWHSGLNTLLKVVASSGTDTLVLEGVRVEDLSFSWANVANQNLLINIAGGPVGDSIRIVQQDVGSPKIEKLELDGLGAMNFVVAGLSAPTVSGGADADLVFGLSGNEQLNGGGGHDILMGGAGNDALNGGIGNDTYHFGPGHGADTLVESGVYGDNDQLVFGNGIDSNELWFAQQGNDLVVSVLATADQVTIKDWFLSPGNVVETIRTGDGMILQHSNVAALVSAMASFDPATSASGDGIQPNDPRLGDPNQIGTIASAMRSSWMAA